MSAKRGMTRSLRLRSSVGICLVVAFMALSAFSSSASAGMPKHPTAYVALGDSLAFGFKEETFALNLPAEPPSAFEQGYVTDLYKKVVGKERHAGNELKLFNFGCPGETSEGLIGHDEALGGNPGAEWNPCAYQNVDGFPLHSSIGSGSQLEAALGVITSGVPVKLVTLNIGANDELHQVGLCENPKYDEEHGFTGFQECLIKESPTLFGRILHNNGDIIGVLRNAGYTGVVGVMGVYNPNAEILPGSDVLQKQLDEVEAATIAKGEFGPGVVYGEIFPKVNPQTGHEQEHICRYTEECNKFDKHINFVKFLEGKGLTHEEAEAVATAEEGKGFVFPEGDIHMTPEGYLLAANALFKAGAQ
jgi:hypothetical protein